MVSIRQSTKEDASILAQMGRQTFIESHSHSAPDHVINEYVQNNYNETAIRGSLKDPANKFHIIYYDDQPAGYSKIIFNHPHAGIPNKNVSKLEKIFLLGRFYDLKLGKQLLAFNIDLAKLHGQSGIWLFVWIENERAIRFYKNHGFQIIGDHNFRLSESHYNPNFIMYLEIG
jgi:diamine N-acetyltransferase